MIKKRVMKVAKQLTASVLAIGTIVAGIKKITCGISIH